MRLLNVFLAILYLSLLLSGETRSAAHAWVDNTKTQFDQSLSLISQQSTQTLDSGTAKEPDSKVPVLLQAKPLDSTHLAADIIYHSPALQKFHSHVLIAAPRAPPHFA